MKLTELQSQFAGDLRAGELLKYHTGLRIGGPASWLAIPRGMEDLRQLLVWAGKNQTPFRVIGNGSSVLAHAEGYEGLVIKLVHVLNHIRVEGNLIYAGAGAVMSDLLLQAFNHNLTGLEQWYGPHTVGGWMTRMGLAGVPGLDHLVKEVYFMSPDGSVTRSFEPSQIYLRNEGVPDTVVEVVFQMQTGGDTEAMARQIDVKRREWEYLTQMNLPLAGPTFLPDEDLTQAFLESKVSGLKAGKCAFLGIGGGFVANLGGVTYDDVQTLLKEVQNRVLQAGITDLREGLCRLQVKEVIQW